MEQGSFGDKILELSFDFEEAYQYFTEELYPLAVSYQKSQTITSTAMCEIDEAIRVGKAGISAATQLLNYQQADQDKRDELVSRIVALQKIKKEFFGSKTITLDDEFLKNG
jgi:hypothetical protein